MSSIDTINKAIQLTKERVSMAPDFAIFDSVLNQLNYLKAVIEGRVDRSRLNKIIVGHYAVHEFEETDPEYSRALKDCQNIAVLLSQGKRIP